MKTAGGVGPRVDLVAVELTHLRVERGDRPVLHLAAHLGDDGRRLVAPLRVVGPHRLHAHRLPDGLREQRRRGGRFFQAAAAVRTGIGDPDHVDLRLGDFEQLGDPLAQREASSASRDHTVTASGLTSTTLQPGPMLACDWNGQRYWACTSVAGRGVDVPPCARFVRSRDRLRPHVVGELGHRRQLACRERSNSR